jgi:LDH2 family malate/lactate/ureidoglycolate dehydrogenase
VPGEQEHRRLTEKTRDGVPLDRAVLDDITTLGRELGVRETLEEISR